MRESGGGIYCKSKPDIGRNDHKGHSLSQISDEGFARSTEKLFEIVRSVQGIDERLEVELWRRRDEGVEFRVGMKMQDEGERATRTAGINASECHLQIAVRVANHR